jgi:hypothetical protein
MAKNTARERPVSVPGNTDLHAVSLVGQLDSGELVASVDSVVEVTTTDLTISNKAVNTVELTINSKTVAIGQAVQFKVIDAVVSGSPYRLKITYTTDSTPAQTKNVYVFFHVEDQ